MKRNIILFILIAALLLALTACGKKKAAESAEPPLLSTDAADTGRLADAEEAENESDAELPADMASGSDAALSGGGAVINSAPQLSGMEVSEAEMGISIRPDILNGVTVDMPEVAEEGDAPSAALPLRAGTYTGSDGSVLTVNSDGTCTYDTDLSGTVNGRSVSGRVTFHGTVDNGVFSFERATYMGIDVTEMAAAAGYSNASYWEQAAAIIYAGG